MSSAARDWQPWHPLQIPLQRHRSNEAVSQMLGHDHAVGLASGPKRASMPCTSPPIPPRVVGLTPPKGSVTATLMMSAGLVARARAKTGADMQTSLEYSSVKGARRSRVLQPDKGRQISWQNNSEQIGRDF